jgi:hypothetical protein
MPNHIHVIQYLPKPRQPFFLPYYIIFLLADFDARHIRLEVYWIIIFVDIFSILCCSLVSLLIRLVVH